MSDTTLNFETADFLVVQDGEKVRFRCPFDLAGMGCAESLPNFISRKGGTEAAILYLTEVLRDETRRIMSKPIRRCPSSSTPTDEIIQLSPVAMSLPWWTFLSARSQIKEVLSGYKVGLRVDAATSSLLSQSVANEASYQRAKSSVVTPSSDVVSRLYGKGFARKLTKEQVRNIGKLVGLTAGATFSVPGAGKTTEALAIFSLRSEPTDRLLVIAPKNAFGAWDEQLQLCVPGSGDFVRLRGGWERIEWLLGQDPRFMLITYQQLPRVRDLIARDLAARRTFVFLDESHRIKSGKGAITADRGSSFRRKAFRQLQLRSS